ncbi:hypothetical protein Cgig2_029950 [Carnegiea gigantea]|uniref:Uncharacterized protein n=1 Tax=Carnegiea gigantea TaxID=171969 RepID=A0A9Q1GV85_9CARY|nr:hypothetical protein Cgig2_029950 [Carnegiea gigantea]
MGHREPEVAYVSPAGLPDPPPLVNSCLVWVNCGNALFPAVYLLRPVTFEMILSDMPYFLSGDLCILGWPVASVRYFMEPGLAAARIFDYIFGMLWPIDGWHWFDAIPNLSPRSGVVATGISNPSFHLSCYCAIGESPVASELISNDIAEAKDFLRQKGVDVGSD